MTEPGKVICVGGPPPCSTTPVVVPNLGGVTSISAGSDVTCALLSDGTVDCWGRNYEGELGDGTTNDSYTPSRVSNLSGVTAVSSDDGHACALLSNGSLQCWGQNAYGQLGDGTTSGTSFCHCSVTPVAVR
jgi:alpha-tubulin suppressor-like RCC1 family protein